MGKSSKRQRKGEHREAQTLKNKQLARPEDALDVWSEGAAELAQDQPEAYGGSNALILGPKQKPAPAAAEAVPTALSKAEARKLRQVTQKKERRDSICKVLGKLHGSSLSAQQLALLRPLHQRGHKETRRQRMAREDALRAAGLAQQEQEKGQQGGGRKSRGDSSDTEASEGAASSESEDEDTRVHIGSPAASNAAAPARDTNEINLGDEEDEEAHDAPFMPAAKRARVGATAVAAAQQQQEGEEEQRKQQQEQQQREALLKLAREEARKARAEAGITDEADEEEAEHERRRAAERAAAAKAGPLRVVAVTRPIAMQEAREKLPIIGMEQEVMEAVALHDVMVLCGETGSGKTTQVPQFLYEAGYGHKAFPERAGAVAITQPRRVAAISTAERVAAELGNELGDIVGYQVRHDKRVGTNSALAFMTDGILLRQLQDDFLLRRYSCVIIDEAHERSLNTDLLLGMLSRVVPLRRSLHDKWVAGGKAGEGVHPLKLIIMSATLRTEDFTANKRLFPSPPPVLRVAARQFPVTIHFSRRTELHDYVGAAFNKVCRIHRELPPGGILVFLTGQREVEYLCRRLRTHFAKKRPKQQSQTDAAGGTAAAGAAGGGVDGVQSSRKRAQHGGKGTAGSPAGSADAVEQTLRPAGQEDEEAAVAGDDEAGEYLQFGGDAAEAGGGFAAEAAALEAGAAAERDDFEALEADEDEEEVEVLGGGQFTPDEIAAAEAHFEERYGLRLGATAATSATAGASAAVAGVAPAAASGPSSQQQQEEQRGPAPVHVLPLYAMLPHALQARVFRDPPPGHRLIVVATNVAETSLTIPGIRYVVDAGRAKQKLLEGSGAGGLSRFEVSWVSKSSCQQRAGRAGRTGPGHCYRLFSSAHFNDTFEQHTAPEIANTALEGVVLVMKAMGVDKVMNFPFPTPPETQALAAALACLTALSAMDEATGKLTPLGTAMAALPISPRHSRMLLEVALWHVRQRWQQVQQGDAALLPPGASGARGSSDAAAAHAGSSSVAGGGLGSVDEGPREAARALPYAVALAAALSSESPFVHIDGLERELPDKDAAQGASAASKQLRDANRSRQAAAAAAHALFRGGSNSSSDGDALAALRALCAYEAAGCRDDWAQEHFLHARNLKEMADLHKQLARMLQLVSDSATTSHYSSRSPLLQQLAQTLAATSSTTSSASSRQGMQVNGPLPQPSQRVGDVLRQALAAGWADQVARRVRAAEYIQRQREGGSGKRHAVRYAAACLDEEVFLHPRSCLHNTSPEYVAYTQIIRTTKRPYMAVVTPLEPHWLATTSSPLAKLSDPLPEPPPFYRPDLDAVLCWREARYGRHEWLLPRITDCHPDADARARTFAAALLSGKALPAFAALQTVLVAQPGTVARPELAGLPRVGELLAALKAKGVDSVAGLASAWAVDASFLKVQLGAWLQGPARGLLEKVWPQMQQEAAAVAAGSGASGGGSAGGAKKQKQGKKRRAVQQ